VVASADSHSPQHQAKRGVAIAVRFDGNGCAFSASLGQPLAPRSILLRLIIWIAAVPSAANDLHSREEKRMSCH